MKMTTLQELGEKYAEKLMAAGDKQLVAKEIAEEIEKLTYDNTNVYLSKEDKKQILDSMRYITGKVMIKEADNKNYLELVNYIQSKLEGGK